MSEFSALPTLWQTLIPLVLLCEAVLELGLCLYRILCRKKMLRGLPCAVYFAVLVVLLFSVTQGDPDEGKDAFLLGAPWIVFAAVAAAVAVHFAVALPRECRRRKHELSPTSVKEATDRLPMGICFSDPDGRIVLCNDTMRRLSFVLCGSEFRMSEDIDAALTHPDVAVEVNGEYYILSDGTVWQFRSTAITVDGDDRWTQTTAQNVTELYLGNIRQDEINRELQEVNRKLRLMYERMADDIRERESLELKVYIHDTIGRSLLTIRDIIGSGGDTDKKLETLREAVGVLTSDRVVPSGTVEEVKLTARALGVTVRTEGYLPQGSTAEELTAAAVRECVTNCLKHAGGDEVYIRMVEQNETYGITVTNNGRIPSGPIREGSGLLSLRHRIEAAGGEMHVAYKPRFALLLTFLRDEREI